MRLLTISTLGLILANLSHADSRMTVRYIAAGSEPTVTTVYSKLPRQRMEYGSTIVIQQPDQNRFLQVDSNAKTYMVIPMGTGGPAPTAPGAAKRGGMVMVTVNTIDTKETKTLLNRTARHIKTTMVHQPMPGACDSAARSIEIDGWYVDLPGEEAPASANQNPATTPAQGCQDQVQYQANGDTNTGVPVAYTMSVKEGNKTTTSSMEVLELATDPLNAALFEAPAGFSLAGSLSDFSRKQAVAATASAPPKAEGKIRIGLLEVSDHSGRSLNPEFLVSELGQALGKTTLDIQRVQDVEQARSVGCDYLLTADVVALKKSAIGQVAGKAAKVSGLVRGFGRGGGASAAASTDTDEQVEATLSYKLTPLTEGHAEASGTVSAKTGAIISLKTAIALASNVTPMLMMAQMYGGMANMGMMSNFLTVQQTTAQMSDPALSGMQAWGAAASAMAAQQAPPASEDKAIHAAFEQVAKAVSASAH